MRNRQDASAALSIEEAEEASERFTAWYHALPGGMNAPVAKIEPGDALVNALVRAMTQFEVDVQHKPHEGGVDPTCAVCRTLIAIVRAVPTEHLHRLRHLPHVTRT